MHFLFLKPKAFMRQLFGESDPDFQQSRVQGGALGLLLLPLGYFPCSNQRSYLATSRATWPRKGKCFF